MVFRSLFGYSVVHCPAVSVVVCLCPVLSTVSISFCPCSTLSTISMFVVGCRPFPCSAVFWSFLWSCLAGHPLFGQRFIPRLPLAIQPTICLYSAVHSDRLSGRLFSTASISKPFQPVAAPATPIRSSVVWPLRLLSGYSGHCCTVVVRLTPLFYSRSIRPLFYSRSIRPLR